MPEDLSLVSEPNFMTTTWKTILKWKQPIITAVKILHGNICLTDCFLPKLTTKCEWGSYSPVGCGLLLMCEMKT